MRMRPRQAFADGPPLFADPRPQGSPAARSLISRRNLEPFLHAILFWSLLLAGPAALDQALSHFSEGPHR